MKAKFVGDPRNPSETVPDLHDAYGLTFERDKYTEVPKELEEKIAGNDHFQVQGAKKPDPDRETAESTAEFSARVNAISDREGLEAMLEAEKRPAARNVLEQRLALLPSAPAA